MPVDQADQAEQAKRSEDDSQSCSPRHLTPEQRYRVHRTVVAFIGDLRTDIRGVFTDLEGKWPT
ncbi:hypothetical protein AB0G97_36255 [Streptomyces sp. NPDC020755]|uniref:hypothetical protein n=1 Tax=Streptomyces sp. NPDC020755 TaxID=3154790 RepID=UPI0033D7F39D